MINSITIKGFKQFRNLSLDTLKPVTLIGDKNNTGKTTILEAIFLFYDRVTPEAMLRHLTWRGVGVTDFSPDSLSSPIFYSYDMTGTVEMEIISESKEKISIAHNKEFQTSIFTMPLTKGIPAKISTSQESSTRESLDFTYYVSDKQIGKSHVIFDTSQLSMQGDRSEKPSKRVTFIGSGLQRNHIEDSIRFGQLDIMLSYSLINANSYAMNLACPKLKSRAKKPKHSPCSPYSVPITCFQNLPAPAKCFVQFDQV